MKAFKSYIIDEKTETEEFKAWVKAYNSDPIEVLEEGYELEIIHFAEEIDLSEFNFFNE